MSFHDKTSWQNAATLKYKSAKMRKSKRSVLFVDDGIIVAVFNLAISKGVVL